MKKKELSLMNLLGLAGSMLWALTIFLREAQLPPNGTLRFLMGVAPNFAVGLLIPALLFVGYPAVFRKELTMRPFLLLILGSYALILVSEIIHDRFLGSAFDGYDLVASLLGFSIMVMAFRARRTATAKAA